MGTPSPATSQAPASSSPPYRHTKRTASIMEEPSDFPQASPSQKRIRLMETALRAGTPGGTPSKPRNINPPQTSPSARLTADNVAFPQTPTRSARRPTIHSPSPSLDPLDFELGSQQSTASTAPDDNMASKLESGELTPELIGSMVNVLGSIPDYIRKLSRKLVAAEKSRDARTKKIEYLEDEVKRSVMKSLHPLNISKAPRGRAARLRDRQKELELIIAGYEGKEL
ncbi:hypothetical protein BYT27DRAFT_6358101 [Phlegmacium glaucopus]|nr:hypothetical protein BYT27DRAFT_6358101 [Phlegmacium glaucopus]